MDFMPRSAIAWAALALAAQAAPPPRPLHTVDLRGLRYAVDGDGKITIRRQGPARVERDGAVFVNGLELKPGVDLRAAGASLAGADLRWVNLSRADLRGLDLSYADLSGADLSHADLTGAILTGAKLDGVRMFKTRILGAVGADLSRAQVHPFFCRLEPEKVGAIRLFMGEDAAIRNLVAGPGGSLYWLQGAGEKTILKMLTRTGATVLPDVGRREPELLAIARDSANRLWIMGREHLQLIDLEKLELKPSTRLPPVMGVRQEMLAGIPAAVAPTRDGSLLVVEGDKVIRLRIDGARVLQDAMSGLPMAQLAVNPADSIIYGVRKGTSQVTCWGLDDKVVFGLEPGSDPSGIAVGADGRVWIARRGESRVFMADPSHPGTVRAITLEAGSDLRRLAMGPDGNLWATGASRILCIAPDGKTRAFPLPRGLQPEEILDGGDGRMLFTTASGRIGSIRALESAGQPMDEIPFGEPPGRPEMKERRRPLAESQKQAEERFDALSATQPEDGAPVAAAVEAKDPEPPVEIDPKAASPSALPPVTRLYDRFVILTSRATRHILGQHNGSVPGKSVFDKSRLSFGALQELIAAGVETAQDDGVFARIRVCDEEGRCRTYCTTKGPVGFYHRYGEKTPTSTFCILTREHVDHRTLERSHDVLTAYPASPHW